MMWLPLNSNVCSEVLLAGIVVLGFDVVDFEWALKN